MDEKPTCAEAAPMHVFTGTNPVCQCGSKTVSKSDLERVEAHYREGCQRRAALAAKMIAALDPEERYVAAMFIKTRHEEFLDDLVACADAFEKLSGAGRNEA